MATLWNEAVISQYITDEIQESLTLEYKSAAALGKREEIKKEITKDVSSMANSAGGTIIYGVAEYQLPSKAHLPERIDPVDQMNFTKEWLQQVINNIRPHIEGIVITPVPMASAPTDVVYVVEIPQSTTAHQANDLRYYKRYNFLSTPMEDYEIRDTMGRRQHPKIELTFAIEATTRQENKDYIGSKVSTFTKYELVVTAHNSGQVYARYVNAFIKIPDAICYKGVFKSEEPTEENGELYREYYEDNTSRDIVDVVPNVHTTLEKYGPSWFDPILPGLSRIWRIMLGNRFFQNATEGLVIKWSVYADNAPPNSGEVSVINIEATNIKK